MKPIAVEVKEDGTTAKVLAKEATLASIANGLVNGTLFVKITDGTDTLLVNTDGSLVVTLKDSSGAEPIDSTTRSLKTVDYAHNEIHSGSAFSYTDYASIKTGGTSTRDILVVTPDTTKWAHMRLSMMASQEVNGILYEGATTSSDGTGVTEVNRNRNSATAATVAVYHTPTVTGTGTAIDNMHIGSGRVGGGGGHENEFVLKQNTKYLIRVTAESATDTDVNVRVFWYEHTN